jgi:hypothetical protein
MSLIIDNSTRLFAVVGAAYVPEHHFGGCGHDAERRVAQRPGSDMVISPPTASAGWWLNDGN